jgi:negative regulator of sigma E activity
LIQLFIGPTERQNAQVNEQLIASIMYRADDGLNRFTLNINRLRGVVCETCARTHSSVLRASALEYAFRPTHQS